MKEDRQGFTLVELITIVAILGLIALIVYPAINSVIKNVKTNSYNNQIAIIEKAAKTWSIDNSNLLKTDGSIYYLPVKELLEEGYISNDEIKDPRNSSKNLTGNIEIKYNSSIKQFTYNYNSSTKEK